MSDMSERHGHRGGGLSHDGLPTEDKAAYFHERMTREATAATL